MAIRASYNWSEKRWEVSKSATNTSDLKQYYGIRSMNSQAPLTHDRKTKSENHSVYGSYSRVWKRILIPMSPKTSLLVSIGTNVFGASEYSVLTLRGGMRALVSLGDTQLELAGGIEFLSFTFLELWEIKFNFGLMVFRTRGKTRRSSAPWQLHWN